MDIEAVFPKNPNWVLYGEDSKTVEVSVTSSPEEIFKVDYLIQIIDQAFYSLGKGFKKFEMYDQISGFLYDLKKLQSTNNNSLMVSCVNLEDSLTHVIIQILLVMILLLNLKF